MSNAQLVTAAKPKVGGAVYRAPLGTPLPTDTTTQLNEKFKSLGYCSEEGITNENPMEVENRKAWGGDVVLVSQVSKEDIWKFKLIEGLNIEVLKTVYGDENVKGTSLDTGISVETDSHELPQSSWVFEMILKNGSLKRVVIPSASISAIDEIKYIATEEIGYSITLNAEADNKGKTHYEYIKKGA